MSHIFISYSRRDLDFAQKIVSALAENELDTWIDWKSIPKGEDWEQEIYRGIEEADAFLFLISPDSVTSEMCNKEIAHAVTNGKRILPIVIRDADVKKFLFENTKEEISKRNWIFCRDGQDDFDDAIKETHKTIHTDFDWLKYHTELQVKALKWQEKKDNSRLVRGKELREAEEQLAKAGSQKDPQPTELHREYLLASQRNEVRQRRQVTIGLGAGLAVLTVLAIFSWIQRNTAITEGNAKATALVNEENARATAEAAKELAETQANISLARQLAAQAMNLPADNGAGLSRSGLLAIESVRRFNNPDGIFALNQFLDTNPLKLLAEMNLEGSVLAIESNLDTSLMAAINSDGLVYVWEPATGDLVMQENLGGTPSLDQCGEDSIDFSPDGSYLVAGCGSNEAIVLNLETEEILFKIIHDDEISAVAFNSDATLVASGGFDGKLKVWALESGALVAENTFDNLIYSLEYLSNNYGIIFGDKQGDVCIWQAPISSFEVTCLESVAEDAILNIEFNPLAEWIITGSYDGIVQVWDINNSQTISTKRFTNTVWDVEISHDGKMVASGDWNGTMQIWEPITGKDLLTIKHNVGVSAIDFSPDGKLIASSSWDDMVHIWDIQSGRDIARGLHEYYVSAVMFSHDGSHIISGGQDGIIRDWEFPDPQIKVPIRIDQVSSTAINTKSDQLAIGGFDGSIQLWNITTGKQTSAKVFHNDTVNDVAFSLDGKWLIYGGQDMLACVWGLEEDITVCLQHLQPVDVVAINSNGTQAASAIYDNGNGVITLWDLPSGNESKKIRIDGCVIELAFSPDRDLLAAGGCNHVVRVWNTKTGYENELLQETLDHQVFALTFSPNNEYLIAGGYDGEVRVWNLMSGNVLFSTKRDTGVDMIAISADAKNMLVVYVDSIAIVWNIHEKKEVARSRPSSGILSTQFNEQANVFTYFTNELVIANLLWDSDKLIENACGRLARNLTHSEWNQYVGDNISYNLTCPNLPEPTE